MYDSHRYTRSTSLSSQKKNQFFFFLNFTARCQFGKVFFRESKRLWPSYYSKSVCSIIRFNKNLKFCYTPVA